MTCNVGKTDRILRVIAGVIILGVGYSMQSWWGLVGLVPLATASVGSCPAYSIFKINTNKTDKTTQES